MYHGPWRGWHTLNSARIFSWDLNAWDIEAGMVIVEESGGSVSDFDVTNADISSRDMIIMWCPDSSVEEGLLRDELI